MTRISDDRLDKLKRDGLIKECSVDPRAIKKLLERAIIDLDTAQRNLNDDPECAFTYSYNAMLRSGLALMFQEGYRPDVKDKHQTVVRFAATVLGKKLDQLISDYDVMRRKRNRFIYEPDMPCSKDEAEFALLSARRFVENIQEIISEINPQKGFDPK
jgi:uncharacterized protein (UPF0332 family)